MTILRQFGDIRIRCFEGLEGGGYPNSRDSPDMLPPNDTSRDAGIRLGGVPVGSGFFCVRCNKGAGRSSALVRKETDDRDGKGPGLRDAPEG